MWHLRACSGHVAVTNVVVEVFCVCYIIMLGLSVCYIIMLGLSVLTVVGVTFLCTNRNSRFYVSLACLLILYSVDKLIIRRKVSSYKPRLLH